MRTFLVIGLSALAVLAVTSCDLFGADAPELQVLARANPGEDAGNMGHANVIYFGKPAEGVHVDVPFTIRNSGSAKLKLKAAGPDYVVIVDHNQAVEPFSVIQGAGTSSIGPDKEVVVTIRFTGQNESTRYTAKLRIPSDDEEHPDYYLELVGDGVTFNN